MIKVISEIQVGRPTTDPAQRFQSGFNLLELLISIAVTGILAAVAVPAYQDYRIRSHVSEALAAGSVAKIAVTEYAASGGNLDDLAGENSNLNAPSSQYVASVAIGADGIITMTTQNTGAVDDPVLELVPSVPGGIVAWECRLLHGLASHVPPSCRGSGSSPMTTVALGRANFSDSVYVPMDNGTASNFLAGYKLAWKDNQLTMPSGVSAVALSKGTPGFSEGTLSADITIGGANAWDGNRGAGLVFGASEGDKGLIGYSFQVDPTFIPYKPPRSTTPSFVLRYYNNGADNSVEMASVPFPEGFDLGGTHNMQVKLEGGNFVGYVDGQKVMEAKLNANIPAGSQYGVRQWSSDLEKSGIKTVVDKLSVTTFK